MKLGSTLIAIERERQIKNEGFSSDHDDDHNAGELSKAALSYLHSAIEQLESITDQTSSIDEQQLSQSFFPWEPKQFKPKEGPIRNLAIAGAFIAAELDRAHRVWGTDGMLDEVDYQILNSFDYQVGYQNTEGLIVANRVKNEFNLTEKEHSIFDLSNDVFDSTGDTNPDLETLIPIVIGDDKHDQN